MPRAADRPVYVAIGVDLAGERDVLGLWLGPTGGEGAKHQAAMGGELRNRGLADALIVCCDPLRGLPESIRATWPDAVVQTCVVHMVPKQPQIRIQEALGPHHQGHAGHLHVSHHRGRRGPLRGVRPRLG